MSNEEVWSESQFVYNLLKDLLLWPITLILFLSKKKDTSELLQPLKDLWKFLTDARMTFALIMVNIGMFILLRVLLYYAGFGIVNDIITGEGFTSLGSFAHNGWNEALVTWQLDHLLLFYQDTIFYHPIFIIPFILAGFTHNHLWHLMGNVFMIFICGRVVEKKIGPWKLLILYLAVDWTTNLIGSVLSVFVFGQYGVAMGASLAGFGIACAAIMLAPFYITYITMIPVPLILIVIFKMTRELMGSAQRILADISGEVNNLGHLLGFLVAIGVIA
ncbi:rhomboid family intramembrane serine protease, partial [Candidatus Woesearchaeota archaeon]|nr:rhomboid family intramembrane serine protease [Candidatus Woesearchaeota archaeon]